MALSMPERLLPTKTDKNASPRKERAFNVLPENMNSDAAEFFARVSPTPLTDAFPRKVAVHAGMSSKPTPKEEIPALLERLHATPRQGRAAAYVHLPYCESKCIYCGFFGGKYTKETGARYLEALIGEIQSEAKYPSVTSAPINALYLGGGTPTALQADELLRLLRTLRDTLPLANDCEITVEGRIHNFDDRKMEACLEGGANRFSIGVQSFDTQIRRRLGRIADRDEVCARLEKLASYNQAAVIIDLIYGLPGQGVEDWAEDIRTFLSLSLEGVDLYQLNIFPGGSLAKAMDAEKIPVAATLSEQTVFFEQGISLMQSARYRRLSMSHWGRTSRERNIYNPLVKGRADCLHYGAGGGGSLHGWFMFNDSNAERYIEQCTGGQKPVAMIAAPPDDLPVMRVILEQMEQCRLNLDDVDAALELCGQGSRKNAREMFAPLLENWEEAGLVTVDGSWVELTLAGQFWLVNLSQALIGWQRQIRKE